MRTKDAKPRMCRKNASWRDAWTAGTPIAPGFGMMNPKTRICTLNLPNGQTLPAVETAVWLTRQRLLDAFSLLERIELDRAYRRDPLFGSLVEERIIWRELIDLELQEADEQIERISASAGDNAQP